MVDRLKGVLWKEMAARLKGICHLEERDGRQTDMKGLCLGEGDGRVGGINTNAKSVWLRT